MKWSSIIPRLILTWMLPVLLGTLHFTASYGQVSGFPFLKNFTARDYKAHPQNFAITSGADGLMYFANFAGVLQYDGHYWRLLPTGKTSRFTSLATDSKGVIQCGAYGEFGYLKVADKGKMTFENYQPAGNGKQVLGKESIATFSTPDGSIFVMSNAIVNAATGKTFFTAEEILSAFYLEGKLYLQLKSSGLVLFLNGKIVTVGGGQLFSGAFGISAILKLDQSKVLVATSTQGLYVMDEKGVQAYPTEADALFRSEIITCGISVNNHGYAFGTARSGIIVLDHQGRLLQIINKQAGMNDDYVHQLYYDKNGVLWAALNSGIAMMELPAALNYFDEKAGLEGGVNAICRFQGKLYVATYQGLFVYENTLRAFRGIPGIQTACWAMLERGNELLIASSEGLYRLSGNTASRIYDGFCLSLVADPFQPGSTFIGTPNGLFQLAASNGKTVAVGGVNEEVKALICDGNGKIWGTLASDKVLQYDPELMKFRVFDSLSGLPETTGACLALWDNTCLALLKSGTYQYQEAEKKFRKVQLADSSTRQGDWYSLMKQDPKGQLWVCSGDQKNIRRMVKKSAVYLEEPSEFLPVSDLVIWCVFSDPSGFTWFGGPDGLISYNPGILTNTGREYPVKLRMISLLNDSVLFFGNTVQGNSDILKNPIIPYQNNSIIFDFASPFYAARGVTLYQYKLEGFDDTWSDWAAVNTKEYTNLSQGIYVFKVRAMNVYGKVSSESSWSFRILPPLYMQWWAYVLYCLITAGALYLFVRIRSRQLMKEKRILEQKIEERTAEVIQQKEEIELQSEELSHKNSELEKINKLVKSINSEINFSSLLQSLLEKMRMIRAVERASALVFDEADQVFRFKAAFGWDFGLLEPLRLTAGQSEQYYLAGAEEVYEDIFIKSRITENDGVETLGGEEPARSVLVVVIKINDRIEAYLVLENMVRDDAFDSKDLSFVLHSKEHIISAFIKTKILEDLQNTLNNLKAAQDQLVQSEKLASLGQLVAGIAHEIQNPLNFVNNFSSLSIDLAKELKESLDKVVDLLDKDQFLDMDEVLEMIKGNVQKINDHGKRASSIVKGMLQHSRGGSGEFETVEVNTFVEEYVTLAYHGMRAKDSSFNTKITTVLDPEAGKMTVVPQDISRVVLNIMNNSCYAVSEKSKKVPPPFAPEIVVSTKRIGNKIEIRIRDNGSGIPPSVLEKIFNPFFTTKPTGQGTGLGLSMSFDIITQGHKGRLEVNTEEGAFTEFVITLPEKN